MQARAIARWSSDGGELRRRAVVTVSGEETEEEEKTKTTAMIIYIRATGRREGDTGIGPTTPKWPLAVTGTPRSRSKLAGVGREVSPCC
jgi:hypothetical protein